MKSPRQRVALALGGLISLLGACASEPASPESSEFELGTGSWRFETIEDGQEVELVRGAQGGWHIWVSLRAIGIDVESGSIEVVTQLADDSRDPQMTQPRVAFDPPNRDGVRQLIGLGETLSHPGCLVDQLVRMEASWISPGGSRLVSEHYVMVRGGTYPPDGCS